MTISLKNYAEWEWDKYDFFEIPFIMKKDINTASEA